MKKIFIVSVLFLSSIMIFAQNSNNGLILNLSNQAANIKKGDTIFVNLPTVGQTDFMFIEKKKSRLNSQLIGTVADIVGAGAMAVGLGANNIDMALGAIDVANKADAISYGADALNQIDQLNISKKAKRIAGKNAIVQNWTIKEGYYIINVKIDNKKYQINYVPAAISNEIKVEGLKRDLRKPQS